MVLPVSEQDLPSLSMFHLAWVIQRISPNEGQVFQEKYMNKHCKLNYLLAWPCNSRHLVHYLNQLVHHMLYLFDGITFNHHGNPK